MSDKELYALCKKYGENGLFEPNNEAKSVPGHRLELESDVQEELLREFLRQRKLEIAREKAKLGALPAKSRYIPVAIRRHLQKEYGTLYLAPLCRGHHAIAHAIDGKVRAIKFYSKR